MPLLDTLDLPLREGALFVDNSFLDALGKCPRALEYQQLRHRTSASVSIGRDFGTAAHLALAYRYRLGPSLSTTTRPVCEAEQVELLNKYFSGHPEWPEDDPRNLNWAVELFVKRYNDTYQVEPFSLIADHNGKPMVEVSGAVPLTAYRDVPIFYAVRIDLPVLWDGGVFILDWKTTSVMGQSFWDDLRVSPQLVGYCWAFEQLTGTRPLGFCVSAIRTNQPPQRPRSGTIENWWTETFQRNREYVSPEMLADWHSNTLELVSEFFYHFERRSFPMKRAWCVGKYGRCQFYEVCSCIPSTRAEMLGSSQFTSYDWSPLTLPH